MNQWINEGGLAALKSLFCPIQNDHISLTYVVPEKGESLTALDLSISIFDGRVHTKLYRKPTHGTGRFVHWSSTHSKTLLASIPFSQLIRIKRNCTFDFDLHHQSSRRSKTDVRNVQSCLPTKFQRRLNLRGAQGQLMYRRRIAEQSWVLLDFKRGQRPRKRRAMLNRIMNHWSLSVWIEVKSPGLTETMKMRATTKRRFGLRTRVVIPVPIPGEHWNGRAGSGRNELSWWRNVWRVGSCISWFR